MAIRQLVASAELCTSSEYTALRMMAPWREDAPCSHTLLSHIHWPGLRLAFCYAHNSLPFPARNMPPLLDQSWHRMQELLSGGAEPECSNAGGVTPLMAAAFFGPQPRRVISAAKRGQCKSGGPRTAPLIIALGCHEQSSAGQLPTPSLSQASRCHLARALGANACSIPLCSSCWGLPLLTVCTE